LSHVKDFQPAQHPTTAPLHVVELAPEARPDGLRLPDFLNVREAAKVLRLSRNRTYELAKLYIASGGAAGLPAFRFGKPIRIPRLALEAYAGGPITWPPVEMPADLLDDAGDRNDDPTDEEPPRTAADPTEHTSEAVGPDHDAVELDPSDAPGQPSLPFEG
jgi:excisionase family DNA binding protein